LEEIFGHFGEIKEVEANFSRRRNEAYVKYKDNNEAEKAYIFMNKAYIDGKLLILEKVRRRRRDEKYQRKREISSRRK
jgi:RNA recognition motif-containing protein